MGRSNVGKSSLINAVVGRRALAHTSKTPGKTRLVNVFQVDDRYYLVDLPGYGYARASKPDRRRFHALLQEYLSTREPLAGVIWLLDVRREPSPDDHEVAELLARRGVPVLAAITKADKLSRTRRGERARHDGGAMRGDQLPHAGGNRAAAGSSRRAGGLRAAARGLLVVALIASAGTVRAQEDQTQALPPAGYGTLRQSDATLGIDTETHLIQIVPLDEAVIRMLANDTYASLHRLRASRAEEIDRAASRWGIRVPTVFLVTFFGRQAQARFQPEILQVTSQNRLFRPMEIIPLSPLWSGQQLNQRETARAIYVYEDGIRLANQMIVSYGRFSSDAWAVIIRMLDAERAAVLARAARDQGKP